MHLYTGCSRKKWHKVCGTTFLQPPVTESCSFNKMSRNKLFTRQRPRSKCSKLNILCFAVGKWTMPISSLYVTIYSNFNRQKVCFMCFTHFVDAQGGGCPGGGECPDTADVTARYTYPLQLSKGGVPIVPTTRLRSNNRTAPCTVPICHQTAAPPAVVHGEQSRIE